MGDIYDNNKTSPLNVLTYLDVSKFEREGYVVGVLKLAASAVTHTLKQELKDQGIASRKIGPILSILKLGATQVDRHFNRQNLLEEIRITKDEIRLLCGNNEGSKPFNDSELMDDIDSYLTGLVDKDTYKNQILALFKSRTQASEQDQPDLPQALPTSFSIFSRIAETYHEFDRVNNESGKKNCEKLLREIFMPHRVEGDGRTSIRGTNEKHLMDLLQGFKSETFREVIKDEFDRLITNPQATLSRQSESF